jgi:GNAT superfamily N-acetyltransferase
MEMYSIKEENSIEIAKELFPLLTAHYNEVEEKSSVVGFNVNWDLLQSFFDAGIMCVVVARVEGKVVGYFANMVAPDFMTSTLVGREVGLYIDPAYRHTRLFLKIMNFATKTLEQRGCAVQHITFKAGHNTELPIKCGFHHTETTYQKVLGG